MGRIATLGAALALAAALGGASAPSAPSAQEAGPRAFDLVFRTGTLDGLPEGTELRYAGPAAAEGASGDGWRSVVVGLAPGGRAVVEGAQDEAAPRVIGSFDAGVGNPLAMVFLESTVNAVAEATGGSPFYIRNRIRDALAAPGQVEEAVARWEGAEVAATEVVLLPFAADAHRAEFGAFADLEIRVVVSEAVPGWYRSISATAPAGEPPAGTPPGGAAGYAASLSLAEAGP
jgi:hypothetical protein